MAEGESKDYGLIGIGPSVELGKDGVRVKDDGSGVAEVRTNDDTGYAKLRADHPVNENDVVTLRFLRTRADVRVTGQIDGGSPPAAGTPGRVFICTTAGGSYTLKYLYYDNGSSWDEIIPGEGLTIQVTDDLTGGTDEYIADHLYMWDLDAVTWRDLGPNPAESETNKSKIITIDYTDTGVNLIKSIPAGAYLTQVKVKVTQVYDGTNPYLEVGDAVDPDRHMTQNQQNLAKVGLYKTEALYLYGAETAVNVTLTVGGTPTQGQCTVMISYILP